MVIERPRKGAFGLGCEAALVMPNGDEGGEKEDCGNDEDDDSGGAEKMARLLAEIVSAKADHGRPSDPPGNIESKEAAPIHLIDAGEQRGEGTEHGNEPPKEDDLAAMLVEQVHAELHLGLVEMEVAAITQQQLVAELAADPVANIVPEHGAGRRGRYHQGDVEVMRSSRIDRRGQQHRLAGNRNADAFDADEQHDGPITVGRYELVELVAGEMHAVSRAPSARPPFPPALSSRRVFASRDPSRRYRSADSAPAGGRACHRRGAARPAPGDRADE